MIASILGNKLEGFKSYNGYYISLCPFHDDANPSFSISKDGLWHCFTCGKKGNIYSLAKKLKFEISNELKLEVLLDQGKKKEYINLEDYSISLPYSYYSVCHPLMKRRTTEKLIKDYKLGLAPETYKNYFIIPISIPGYSAYQCRHFMRKPPIGFKRWLFPAGFTKVVFPWYDNFDELILTEGFFSMLKCEEWGYQASCIFGQQITDIQLVMLIRMGIQRLFICFDGNEKNSLRNAVNISKRLVDYFTVFIMLIENGDPEEISEKYFSDAFSLAFNFSEFWYKKRKQRELLNFNKIINFKR